MSFALIRGMRAYYHKSGIGGIWFYLRMRIYHRFVKGIKHADWHYFLDPERVLTKRFEEGISLVDDRFDVYGNYHICNLKPLTADSIVYSLGVLRNTDFDQAVASAFNCFIYLFDPSIIATRHINKLNHSKFIFEEIAIWKEAGEMKFTTPVFGGSPSMILDYTGQTFTAKSKTLSQVMEYHQHQQIDLIKLDVEGAAPAILNDMLDRHIFPSQVIAEFERPRSGNADEFFEFFSEIQALIRRMIAMEYQVWRLPRDKYCFYSLELIFVRLP